MTPPVLCVLQMRLHSTRLPRKMLLPLGQDKSLAARGWRIACEAFGVENCVVAIPAIDSDGPLGDELRRIAATVFTWNGDERDVLGRFAACAQMYRWREDSVVVRYTPDDFRRDPEAMRRVANGAREAVQIGGEAFTMAALLEREQTSRGILDTMAKDYEIAGNPREHLTYAFFYANPAPEPPADGYPWSIDTEADYRRACEWVEKHEKPAPLTHDKIMDVLNRLVMT